MHSAAFLFAFCCILLISCAHTVKQKQTESQPATAPKPVKYLKKEKLEFALAGEAGGTYLDVQENAAVDSVRPETGTKAPARKKAVKPKTKKDSLFAAMLETAKRLRNEDTQPPAAALSDSPMPEMRAVEQAPATVPRIRETTRQKSAPAPKSNIKKAAQEKPVQEIDDNDPGYQRMVAQLLSGDRPVSVKIGEGRRYWIGTLASHLFHPGSDGFSRALEWIVEHNSRYHTIRDLDMVRIGENILLPTRKIIRTVLASRNAQIVTVEKNM